MMGLEEHLLHMFREDFEFNDAAQPSHLPQATPAAGAPDREMATAAGPLIEVPKALAWADDAERELKKIPFFVRGKARRNTERFASETGVRTITLETLYDAKAHFSR
jgi:light-independent protochlorophyllide reductase subunit B